MQDIELSTINSTNTRNNILKTHKTVDLNKNELDSDDGKFDFTNSLGDGVDYAKDASNGLSAQKC